jgi:hypothetical protein
MITSFKRKNTIVLNANDDRLLYMQRFNKMIGISKIKKSLLTYLFASIICTLLFVNYRVTHIILDSF